MRIEVKAALITAGIVGALLTFAGALAAVVLLLPDQAWMLVPGFFGIILLAIIYNGVLTHLRFHERWYPTPPRRTSRKEVWRS